MPLKKFLRLLPYSVRDCERKFFICTVASLSLLLGRGNGLLEGNLFIKIMC